MNTTEMINNATIEELQEIASAISERLWTPQHIMSYFDKKSSWYYGLAKSQVEAQQELWSELEACKIEVSFGGGSTTYYLAEEVKKLEYSVKRAGATKWSIASQPVRDAFSTLRSYVLPGDENAVWPSKIYSDNYKSETMSDDSQLAALQAALGMTDENSVTEHHEACERFIDIALRIRSRQTYTEDEAAWADSVGESMKAYEAESLKTLT